MSSSLRSPLPLLVLLLPFSLARGAEERYDQWFRVDAVYRGIGKKNLQDIGKALLEVKHGAKPDHFSIRARGEVSLPDDPVYYRMSFTSKFVLSRDTVHRIEDTEDSTPIQQVTPEWREAYDKFKETLWTLLPLVHLLPDEVAGSSVEWSYMTNSRRIVLRRPAGTNPLQITAYEGDRALAKFFFTRDGEGLPQIQKFYLKIPSKHVSIVYIARDPPAAGE